MSSAEDRQLTIFLDRFDAAWASGTVPEIPDFLPDDASGVTSRLVLIELVMIDLERRWRASTVEAASLQSTTKQLPARPTLEDYVARYAELIAVDSLPIELICAEYRVRRQWGDQPGHEEYLRRFPMQGTELQSALAKFDQEASISVTIKSSPPNTSASHEGGTPEKTGTIPDPSVGERVRYIGEYQLLEEIARGGMGVVFKARQTKLNRIVALKMILSGELAGEEEVQRFKTEAEAAANLDHPGIVPIYEIGEHQGQYYFSMGLVEGQSLADRAKEDPLPPKEAAEIVKKVTEAVAHAHEKGVIHRDLKPANVLLDVHGEPRVTDFGLAKHVESDSDLTRTGAVMGTPSYMPPEQASGKTEEVGPRADVYSLGAILYCLLTGRPPFLAANPMETVLQVLNKEPVPPRKHNAKLPLDLEIICLRCLEKDPRRRLQSAAALRDELTRFLNHEPIESRPVGAGEKTWRWCAKRPLLVGLVASVLFAIAAITTTAYLYRFARAATALANVSEQFDRGLESLEWNSQHVAELEGLIAEIDRLAPGKTADANARMNQRLQAYFDELLRKPSLDREDREHIDRVAKLIVARSPTPGETKASLGEAIDRRMQVWEVIFNLSAPFGDFTNVFPKARLENGLLFLQKPAQTPPPDEKAEEQTSDGKGKSPRPPSAMSTILCDTNVKLEAEFPVGWEQAAHLGLILNGENEQGYAFLISGKASTNSKQIAANFATAAAANGFVVARVYRNGVRLTEKTFPIAPLSVGADKLYLTATRQGDQLSFQINASEPITLRDLFPISSEQPGSFGVYLPRDRAISLVRASRQSTPPSPSPLESGDLLYAKGEFREAIQAYQQQAIEAREMQFRYQASYKAGICQVKLKRLDEAREVFARMVTKADKEWSIRAACQLWLIQLRQNREKDADETLQHLSSLYSFEKLATLIPPDDRDQLLKAYQGAVGGGYLAIIHNKNRLRNLERLVAVNRVLGVSRGKRYDGRRALMSEYLRHEQIAAASQLANELVTETWISPKSRWYLLIDCVWIASKTGDTAKWMEEIDHRLVGAKSDQYSVDYLPLLIERARLRIIDEDWEQAEADAARAYQLRAQMPDHASTESCLLYGFLLEKKGDIEKAEEVWHQGFQEAKRKGRVQFLGPTMLGSLTGCVTVEDAERVMAGVADSGVTGPYIAYFRNKFVPLEVAQGVLNNMWRQTRGRQAARDITFRKSGFWESEYLQVLIATSEIWRQCIAGTFEFQGDLSPIHEEIIWNVTTRLVERFRQGKFSESRLLHTALTWKGQTGSFGWRGLAAALDKDSRAELGYIMGCRFARQLKQVEDARFLFQEALKNCLPDSKLAKLIQAELAKLPKQDEPSESM